MDALDDIALRLRITKLNALCELVEIERDALMREIMSPHTTEERRGVCFDRRAELITRRLEMTEELKTLDASASY
jgi:hypothetical protein